MNDERVTPTKLWTNYTTHNCREWLGFWSRWSPLSGDIKVESFKSIRHIQLINESKMKHQNTFIYDNGTSVDTGPFNGPWEYLRDRDCDEQGMIHPSSRKSGNDARAFFVHNGGGAWTIMEVKENKVFFLELFFPDKFKRFSTGIIFDAEGKAARLTFIREDNRGRPSSYWSEDTTFKDDFQTTGEYHGVEITLTAGLQQTTETGCSWNRDYWLKEKRSQEEGNTVVYLPDRVMTSFPSGIDSGHSFHVSTFCHYTEGDQNEIREQTLHFRNGKFSHFKQGIYFPK